MKVLAGMTITEPEHQAIKLADRTQCGGFLYALIDPLADGPVLPLGLFSVDRTV